MDRDEQNEMDFLRETVDEADVQIKRMEAQLEDLWLATKGVHPTTGRAWLTPSMERDSADLAAILGPPPLSEAERKGRYPISPAEQLG